VLIEPPLPLLPPPPGWCACAAPASATTMH